MIKISNQNLLHAVIALLISAIFTPLVYSQEINVKDVLAKSSWIVNYAGSGKICSVHMLALEGDGRADEKNFQTIRFFDQDGNTQQLQVYPSNSNLLSDVATAIWEKLGRQNIMRPCASVVESLGQIASITDPTECITLPDARQKNLPFKLSTDHYQLIDSSDHHFLIKGTPPAAANHAYKYYLVWILNNSYIPVEIEFYDKDDSLVKLIEVLEIKTIQGYPTIVKTLVDDLSRGEKIETKYRDVVYEQASDDLPRNRRSLLRSKNIPPTTQYRRPN